ncbi:MAG: hypothetical protein ABS37_15095 [Acidovorax sp. SCN 65-108]|nr:MAG: hypothetical protein ABS37_15095 [Acidovorax sp. SCN 65-108]
MQGNALGKRMGATRVQSEHLAQQNISAVLIIIVAINGCAPPLPHVQKLGHQTGMECGCSDCSELARGISR